jgi:uncharacterized protein (TIGR00266 family)
MATFTVLGESDPLIKVDLCQGESVWCESDAMVMMDNTLDLKGRMKGGLLQAAIRTVANGESFFQQEITASRGNGMCLLAPKLPGAVKILDVGTVQYRVSDEAYMAASSGVSLTAQSQKFGVAIFGNTGGFFVGETSGTGQVAVSGFGMIVALDITKGREVTIDTGHLVAWDNRMNYEIASGTAQNQGLFGSLVNSVTSGEMFVLKFHGPGKVIVCSRNRNDFRQWIASVRGGR